MPPFFETLIHTCSSLKKGKALLFTSVTAKLEACMLAVDLSVLPPAKLVLTYAAK